MTDSITPSDLPPVLRFEVEYGDRRALAEIPAIDATLEWVTAATEWLTRINNDWTIR